VVSGAWVEGCQGRKRFCGAGNAKKRCGGP
jgi:hypothetical protein